MCFTYVCPEGCCYHLSGHIFLKGIRAMKNNYADEKWIGKHFGTLTVVATEKVYRGKTTAYNWICLCDCGNITSVNPYKLIHGKTISCGCEKRNRIISFNKETKVKHNGRKDNLYAIWKGMKQRCYNENCFDYHNYGERGIEVCDQWLSDYASFRDWSIKNGYERGLSIDRVDVNGNYSPDNCRWVGCFEQSNNRRNNVRYNYEGEMLTLSEISKLTGISYGTLHMRLMKGWSEDRAFHTRTDTSKRNYLAR